MARKSKLDEMLEDLVRGKSPEEILGDSGLVKELTKRLAETALNAELAAHLGYEKHAPEGRNKGNSRNGRALKRVKTESGELEVEVPRDRDGTFEPQLIRKRQRRLAGQGENLQSQPIGSSRNDVPIDLRITQRFYREVITGGAR